ncbi:MAG TPA: SWIM zinc finger family protein [Amycolatopsis sp.]|nr:SWIM zinc finger family protein [Amycolatopsis sp.]
MSPRRTFGSTWWGQAWVEALEGRAKLDPNRLPRGRTYARQRRVSALDVTAGEVRAWVRGSRSVPYRVTIRVQTFSERQWGVLLETIGTRLGYTAALLDGELPPELASHARAAGADLLPGPGDLRPRCSCPDSADPCKHAAAVCYLVADEVDADPFVLFLIRGRGREKVLRELRARRARPAVPATAVAEGVAPEEAFARAVSRVPPVPSPPAEPGPPAPLPAEPPPGSALRAQALSELAASAAALAWELVTGQLDSAELTTEEDLARRAARGDVAALAKAAGMPRQDLTRWAAAWREAGRGGLAALREAWQAPRGRLAEAVAALAEADLPGETQIWRNRLTRGDIQLRLGRDGKWYLFRRTPGGWLPAGPGADSPLDALP